MCETLIHFYPFKIKQMLRGCYMKASQEGWCKNIERIEKLTFSRKTSKDLVLQTWDVEMHVGMHVWKYYFLTWSEIADLGIKCVRVVLHTSIYHYAEFGKKFQMTSKGWFSNLQAYLGDCLQAREPLSESITSPRANPPANPVSVCVLLIRSCFPHGSIGL